MDLMSRYPGKSATSRCSASSTLSPGRVSRTPRALARKPPASPASSCSAGEVGYFVANVRGVRETRPGDSVLDAEHRDVALLPGYRDIKSMVFAGLYPTEPNQFEELRDALAKLQLNDASLHYEPESSVALGFGFRCGFLGLLHMEIVR